MQNKWAPFLFLFTVSAIAFANEESVAAVEEYTAFDLYLGERQVGIATAYYKSNGQFRAEDPQDIINTLALDNYSEEALALFEEEFNTEKKIDNVGSVKIDFNIFKITILLNERFFNVKKLDESSIKTNKKTKPSLRLDVNANYQESTSGTSRINFKNFGNLSIGSSWLEYSSSIEKIQDNDPTDESFEHVLEELNISTVFDRWHLKAGYVSTLTNSLIPSIDIIGASFFNENLLLEGVEDMRGSTLEIYVPTKSVVNFYQDDLLIDSQVLNSGKQQVNTNRFPQGSYFVDVEILADPSRAKRRFYFAKSGFLSPRKFPGFRLDVGQKRIGIKKLEEEYFSSELKVRVIDSADLIAATFGTKDKIGYLLGFNALIYDLLFFGSASWEKASNQGLNFGMAWNNDGFSISSEYEKSFSIKEEDPIGEIFASIEEEQPIEDFTLNQLDKSEKINMYLAQRIRDFEVKYSSSFIREKGGTVKKTYGPTVVYNLSYDTRNTWSVEFAYRKSDEIKNSFFLGINWQQRYDKFTLDSRFFANSRERNEVYSAFNKANYNDISSKTGLGIRADVQSRLEFDELTDYEYKHSLSTNLEYGFSHAKLLVNTTNQNTKNSSSQGRSYSIGTSLIADLNGNVAMGPTGLSESIVIVNLNSFDEDIATEILLNKTSTGVIEGNGKILLSINPYQQNSVRIKPAKDSPIIRYDSQQADFLLFPGQVYQLDYNIERVHIAIGRLLDKSNNPLEFKNIKGSKDINYTEADGYFQLELSSSDTLTVETADMKCTINFPAVKNIKYFHDYGDVICQ